MKEYDKDTDTWFKHFGKADILHSRELENVNIIVDFDKDNNIVGIEIEGFRKAIRESDKKIDEIFNIKEKNGN